MPLDVVVQFPPEQAWLEPHAAQKAPPAPHAVEDVPALQVESASQHPPHDVESHAHVPETHR